MEGNGFKGPEKKPGSNLRNKDSEKSVDSVEVSKKLEDGGYFEALESSFFSKEQWGEPVGEMEEVKALLPQDVVARLKPEALDHYLAGISKRHQKPHIAVFWEFLKDHPNVSWSSLAVMNYDRISVGWFAGARTEGKIKSLLRTRFTGPVLVDIRDTNKVCMQMPFQDMLAMLPEAERVDVDVFIGSILKEWFAEQGGIEKISVEDAYKALRRRIGHVLPPSTPNGFMKGLVALHGVRTKFLETFVGTNIAPFEHLQRILAQIEHMAHQARFATDITTKHYFALRARLMLDEDFTERVADMKKEKPIPEQYAKIFSDRMHGITEDLEEAERQLRAAS